MDYKKLINKAKKLRQDTFLSFIKKKRGHVGGSFSMIEILLTLYEVIMKKNVDKESINFIMEGV